MMKDKKIYYVVCRHGGIMDAEDTCCMLSVKGNAVEKLSPNKCSECVYGENEYRNPEGE